MSFTPTETLFTVLLKAFTALLKAFTAPEMPSTVLLSMFRAL